MSSPFLFPLHTSCAPQEITSASGELWTNCYQENVIYRVATTGSRTGIPVPPQSSQFGSVSAVAAGRTGTVWFSELSTDRLGVIHTG